MNTDQKQVTTHLELVTIFFLICVHLRNLWRISLHLVWLRLDRAKSFVVKFFFSVLHLCEILQHGQSHALALLRMKLRRKYIVAPHRRGERRRIVGFRHDERSIRGIGVKRMHEINRIAVFQTAKQRAIRPHPQRIPAHVRDFQPRLIFEPHHVALEDIQPQMDAIFVAARE